MDQAIRHKLRGVVTQCRKLLEEATAQALQGRFGMYAARKKGEVQVEEESRMAHLAEEDRACRQDLLDHLEHIQAIGYKPSEALEQLVREIAFTHLNRLCAYKMMEARGLIREAVSRGLKSQGFFFYLSDHPEDEKLHNCGRQEAAYRNFLDWLGGTLSQEIGVLFNPNNPANRIYPPQRVLDEVLALINDGELKDIWSQDETIGWVYQYFTPKELRDKARKESQAPRNSYELAFRNQFFTPRYVVEFLTDNTLGRIWHEMRKGKTVLKDRCRYLVRRPSEIFLKEGEQPPAEAKEAREDISQEKLLKQPVHISHRPKKDPREIKVLDPACGSGHFLLYCFDLLQVIYEEAYDDPDLGASLRRDYPAIEDLRRALPGLILKHNLHGIDIDLRATQIAALALWLRCQRAYQELGLKNGERPKITRSNIICAEPMPGEMDLLKEFTATLQPKVLGQLVEVVFEKMKLAGEAGSLLKIEEEIRDATMTAKKEYQEELRRQKEQAGYLPGMAPPRERTLFDFSDITDSEFLDRAEEEIVAALRQYAEKTSNGRGFRRRLFAEDAARGFSFVDVCRKRFDVVLMNPPFGEVSSGVKDYIFSEYGDYKYDIYAAFVIRGSDLLEENGKLGAITSRTGFFLTSLKKWRGRFLHDLPLAAFADLGLGVLDSAMVEACCFSLSRGQAPETCAFFDCIPEADKANALKGLIHKQQAIWRNPNVFRTIPNYPFAYWAPTTLLSIFENHDTVYDAGFRVRQGLGSSDNFRFLRSWWEVSPDTIGFRNRWASYAKGGGYLPYWADQDLLVLWADDGKEIKEYSSQLYGSWSKQITNVEFYSRPGLTYSSRTSSEFSPRILPSGSAFDTKGSCIFDQNGPDDKERLKQLLVILQSSAFRSLLNMCVATSGETARSYTEALVERMPIPSLSCVSEKSISDVHSLVIATAKCEQVLEQTHAFVTPVFRISSLGDITEDVRQVVKNTISLYKSIVSSLEYEITGAYGLDASVYATYVEPVSPPQSFALEAEFTNLAYSCAASIWSWAVGCVFGRWDIRFATGERQPSELPDPFDPLPVCPPGMLHGPDGLPAKPGDVPSDYPLHIDWDGILVDDPGHEDDIVRRVSNVLEVIWKERAEAIEREACEILGVRELRDYFRKPGSWGFWMDHVKRYSKSRRKAPIYWYLRSAKGNYGLWLYYHRLDKDILFKALLNYVEPKIRLEEDRLKTLRGRKEAAGSSGREAKQIEKDLDRQEQFVSELRDFADKLRRAANLHLDPDLNDGVVLNIAPSWELAPWKEAKQYWDELVEGKYEWSSIGKQLREKGLVR